MPEVIVFPAEQRGEGEADQHGKPHMAYSTLRDVECGKCLGGDLHRHPGRHDVDRRHAKHAAAPQFPQHLLQLAQSGLLRRDCESNQSG
jgi:hypothetical protein